MYTCALQNPASGIVEAICRNFSPCNFTISPLFQRNRKHIEYIVCSILIMGKIVMVFLNQFSFDSLNRKDGLSLMQHFTVRNGNQKARKFWVPIGYHTHVTRQRFKLFKRGLDGLNFREEKEERVVGWRERDRINPGHPKHLNSPDRRWVPPSVGTQNFSKK